MNDNLLPEMVDDPERELEAARRSAERYRFGFVDLREMRSDPDILRSIPLDLMLDYQFLPLEAKGSQLSIAVGDPSNLARLDEHACVFHFLGQQLRQGLGLIDRVLLLGEFLLEFAEVLLDHLQPFGVGDRRQQQEEHRREIEPAEQVSVTRSLFFLLVT